jgi:hypothetical protein
LGVTPCRGDSEQLDIRAGQRKRESKRVVNVAADIRVDNNFLPDHSSGSGLRMGETRKREKEDND